MPTKDGRWPKLKVGEIEQALLKQASYKAPGPESIKTIAIKKAWKDSEFRSVATTLFSERIHIEYHLEVFREGQIVILKSPTSLKILRDPTDRLLYSIVRVRYSRRWFRRDWYC
jgi:hypothetical protein